MNLRDLVRRRPPEPPPKRMKLSRLTYIWEKEPEGRWPEARVRARVLLCIAQQRANLEQDRCDVGRVRRYALCIKAAICVLTGSIRYGFPDYWMSVVDVCAWDYNRTPSLDLPDYAAEWKQLSVASGLVRGWVVRAYTDANV